MLALLTDELGRTITAAELGWRSADVEAVSALSGLVLPWTAVGSLRALRVVTDAGGMDRRILLTLLGSFAPYRRRPAVRQLTEQAAGLLKR
ncbi:MAG: hypothetical protein ACRDTF_00715 [Pseudonocardiaceae bacterium]